MDSSVQIFPFIVLKSLLRLSSIILYDSQKLIISESRLITRHSSIFHVYISRARSAD